VADYREECYGSRHTPYLAVAALFVAVYPVGIVVGAWAVLRWFRVPQVAAAKQRAAVLRAPHHPRLARSWGPTTPPPASHAPRPAQASFS